MDINARIARIVESRTGELVALRRELHQHPELAFEEHETARAVTAFAVSCSSNASSGC